MFKLGRYEEARSHVGKAAEADPDFIPYRILLAWDDVKLGQTELAIQGLREALEKNPMEISVCINLAKIYETIKSPGALDQWRYCLEIYQSNPQAFSASAGEIFQALQRLQPGK